MILLAISTAIVALIESFIKIKVVATQLLRIIVTINAVKVVAIC